MTGRWLVRSVLAAAVLFGTSPLQAQLPRPLGPRPDNGLRVAPFFDGWYSNPDGTISYSFGFSNLNQDSVEIPLGPNNFIVPKDYDGRQPTHFPPVGPASRRVPRGARGGGAGGDGNAYERERGVFTITVPGSFKGDVVWTLRYQGQTWAIPARSKSTTYQLSWPMAMGSVPPLLRFQPNGTAGRGPTGIYGPVLQAKVGTPLDLSIWLTDDAVHEKEPVPVKREVVPSMNVLWVKHAGPAAPVTFSTEKGPVSDPQGKTSTTATFTEPGEYVLRVRGDSFGNIDSSAADQCCWTNGYWKVVVTR